MSKKLPTLLFAVTGLLPAVANAESSIREAKTTTVIPSSDTDLAPVTATTPARLKHSDDAQPGNEMAHAAMFGDGKTGLYFSMATDLTRLTGTPTPAPDRVQLAVVPFHLAQATDGSVSAVVDGTGARFATNNVGNEYRNANHPIAYAAFGGDNICAEYNYQVLGGNDTQRYLQCFDKTGATVLPQTLIYAKINDDCSMNQDSTSTWVTKADATTTKLVAWRGCNGNGQDDGWLQAFTLTKTGGTITFAQTVDVSLCPREERSHGFCTTSTADPNTAYCSWTEGNTQPQRDGTWMAAVDISGATTGQAAILWKQQIDGRKLTAEGLATYSMRAMTDRIMALNPTTGKLEATDLVFWRSGDVHGNNNAGGKGGAYLGNQMAVMKLTKEAPGITYVVPMTNMQSKLIGLDGTHLGMATALFGTADKLMPGLVFLGGSQIGGGYSAQMRAVGWDQGTNAFKDLGMTSLAPYDRHLYPNYLGNNPGNQGRNYSGVAMIANPFVDQHGNTDKFLMLIATTGKAQAEKDIAERKLSAFLTVVPIAQSRASGGTGTDPGIGTDPGTGNTDPNQPSDSLGNCSTTGSNGGIVTFLLIGMVAFIRRRK